MFGIDSPCTRTSPESGVEQADDVLDQHALAGPRGAEHHRDLVLGQAEVEAVEDAGAAELLDQVDDLDRVFAAVVALAAGVEAVGVGLGGVDAGDDEVAAHHRAVLAYVGAAGGGPCLRRRRLGARCGLVLQSSSSRGSRRRSARQPPIGALGLAPQKIRVPSIPMMWTKTMLSTIDFAVAVPTPTGPPDAV